MVMRRVSVPKIEELASSVEPVVSRLYFWRHLSCARRPSFLAALRPFRFHGMVFDPLAMQRLGKWASALLLLSAGFYGAVRSGDIEGYETQALIHLNYGARTVGLAVSDVAITGMNELAAWQVLDALDVDAETSLPFYDVSAARERLEAMPWVEKVSLRKLYPNRLQVHIVEREALAVWQRDGQFGVIDTAGRLVAKSVEERFAHLPLVVGEGAHKEARDMLALISRYPAIKEKMQALVRVGQRRWNVHLRNGIDIRLPETGVAEALQLVATYDVEHHLLAKDIIAVDVRGQGKIVVRLSDAAADQRREFLKTRLKKRVGPET